MPDLTKVKAALEAIVAIDKPHPKCRDAHEAVRIARAALRELEPTSQPCECPMRTALLEFAGGYGEDARLAIAALNSPCPVQDAMSPAQGCAMAQELDAIEAALLLMEDMAHNDSQASQAENALKVMPSIRTAAMQRDQLSNALFRSLTRVTVLESERDALKADALGSRIARADRVSP